MATTSLLALLLARSLAAKIVSPIERLTERLATGALVPGSLEVVIPEDLTRESRTDEIATLARTLRRAGEELTASSERERRFLREASHELRTPITVIQGVSDLLRDSMDAEDRPTQERLDRLDRGLRRMNTSVLSLLAMARAEHRAAVTEMPSFRQQLEDLVEEARTLARPGVVVTCQLHGDPPLGLAGSMLIVALANLTRNAVQHAETGDVSVEVTSLRAQVRDRGPGLPTPLLEQLRSPGPQSEVGLGLATVLRICRRFGWRLDIVCPPAGGTVATLELA